MSEKKHLSISQINTLGRCGEQYRRRYIEGEKIPPGIAALVGRGVDDSVTANLSKKIETGSLLTTEEALQTAMDSVERQWQAGEVSLTDEEVLSGAQSVRGAAIDKAVRLAALHAADTAPRIEPVAVQRRWTLEMDNFPFDLVGVTDVEEARTTRDTKTSGKSLPANAADVSDQLTVYALARKVVDGFIPDEVILDGLIDNKIPKTQTLRSTRTDEDFRPMLHRIEAAADSIVKEAFIPAAQDSWICNPRWCGYANDCKYYRKALSVPVGG